MATDFGQTPAALLSLTDPQDAWLAWQVNRAVWKWGRFVKAKIEETIEVPHVQQRGPLKDIKPKYKPEQIHDMIYGQLVDRRAVAARTAELATLRPDEVAARLAAGERFDVAPTPSTRRFADPRTMPSPDRSRALDEDDVYVPLTEEDEIGE